MAGVKGRSGRLKTPETIKQELRFLFHNNADKIWQTIIDKAIAGNLEAAIYLIDREYGRPKQSIDANVQGDLRVYNPDEFRAINAQVIDLGINAVRELPTGNENLLPVSNEDNSNGMTMDSTLKAGVESTASITSGDNLPPKENKSPD